MSYTRLTIKLRKEARAMTNQNLLHVDEGKEYIIQDINTQDAEMDSFLFSLGCYSGEPITVVRRRHATCVVAVKDGRYCIDRQLAQAIRV